MAPLYRVRKSDDVPNIRVFDQLLVGIATRIQLTPTLYSLAEDRFHHHAERIDSPGSPLHGRVEEVYAQGSMAIGTTIRSNDQSDLFDIDVLVQLELDEGTEPLEALKLLEQAIRREPGSKYYDCTTLNTRCVTVEYAEMKIDFTPQVRNFNLPERAGLIPHAKVEEPKRAHKFVLSNPYGFARWFIDVTDADEWFAVEYAKRSYEADAQMGVAKADTEPLPDLESVFKKPIAVVSLQLIKRWVQQVFHSRPGRWPPSILLSKLVADQSGGRTLSECLLAHARYIRAKLEAAENNGRLIVESNPALEPEKFTDRWPVDAAAQQQFIGDLRKFEAEIIRLSGDLPLEEMVKGLSKLFGEDIAQTAAKRYLNEISNSRLKPVPVARATGRVAPVVAAGSRVILPPPHRYYGEGE